MTKLELLNINRVLNQLGKLKGAKFAYGVTKNLNLLKPEMESIEKAGAASEEYVKFEKEVRLPLVEKYAKRDEEGKLIVKGGNYEIENQEEFDKEFEKIKKENQEVWNEREKQVNEYGSFLNTESTLELYKINFSDFPQDISVEQMYQLSAIINEDEKIVSPYNQ